MAYELIDLNLPWAFGPSDALEVLPGQNVTIYITGGVFSATLRLQVSIDGIEWIYEGNNIVSQRVVTLAKVAPFVRMHVNSYTSGSPVAKALYGP